MRATASAILDGLLVVGLPLVVGLFGWLTDGYVAWGAGLLAALAGLFVVRLRAQWRASAAIAGDWAPDPAPGLRLARWGTSRLLKVLRTFAGTRYLSFEHVVFVLLAAAVFYQVLGPPVVGLADNGDFGWIISQAGLEEIEATSDEDSNFINLHFLANQPHSLGSGYVSSELIFVEAAVLLSTSASEDALFDLRALGIFHAAAFLAVLVLVLRTARSLPKAPRWVSGILLLIVFTDVGYVAYFNSFYREPAALIFLALAIACALRYIWAPKANPALLLAFFVAAALFVTAKPQYAPQGALLAVFGLSLSRRWWSLWSYRPPEEEPPWRNKWRGAVLVSAAMALALCLIGAWSYFWQPTAPREVVLYNHVFYDLLVQSPTPEADLGYLGLDPDLVEWAGTEVSDEEDAPMGDPAFKEDFLDKVTLARLGMFYATHPGRAVELLDRVAKQGLSLRPGYLGNFEEASGFSPGAQSHAFDGWSNARESFPSKSLAGFLVVFGLAMWAGIVVWRRCATLQGRMLAELFVLLVVMAAADFVLVCLSGGGLDVVKHLFAFNLLLDIGAIMAAGYAAKWWTEVAK